MFNVAFSLHAGTPPGSYHLFGVITGGHGITHGNPTNDIVRSIAPIVVTNMPVASARRHHDHLDSELFEYDTEVSPAADAGLALGATALAVDSGSNSDQADQSAGDTTTQPTTAPSTQPSDSGGNSNGTDPSSGDGGGASDDTSDQ